MTLAMEMLHSQIDPALIAKCTKLSIDFTKDDASDKKIKSLS